MTKKVRKILSMIIVFVLTVVNYGFPLQAMAAEGNSFFNFRLFKKDEIEFKAYFGDDEDNLEENANVNDVNINFLNIIFIAVTPPKKTGFKIVDVIEKPVKTKNVVSIGIISFIILIVLSIVS